MTQSSQRTVTSVPVFIKIKGSDGRNHTTAREGSPTVLPTPSRSVCVREDLFYFALEWRVFQEKSFLHTKKVFQKSIVGKVRGSGTVHRYEIEISSSQEFVVTKTVGVGVLVNSTDLYEKSVDFLTMTVHPRISDSYDDFV